jgi:hypothetical protein
MSKPIPYFLNQVGVNTVDFCRRQAYYLCLEHMAPSGNSLRSKTRLYDPDDSDVMIHSDAKMIQVNSTNIVMRILCRNL